MQSDWAQVLSILGDPLPPTEPPDVSEAAFLQSHTCNSDYFNIPGGCCVEDTKGSLCSGLNLC